MNVKIVAISAIAILCCAFIVVNGNVNVTVDEDGYGSIVRDRGYGSVTLTAVPDEGYVFAGWYSGDTAVSFDNPFTVNEDCSLHATYLPAKTVKTFTWMSDATTQEFFSVEMDAKEYLDIRNDPDAVRSGNAADSMGKLAVSDTAVSQIARFVTEETSDGSASPAEYAVRFVQGAIQYQSDTARYGGDHWKYPAETLWDSAGDCEDTAILLVTLLGTLGYDTVLVEFEGHIGCAVSIPGADPNWTVDGVTYSYVETAVDGSYYPIGYLSGYLPEDARLIPVSLTEAGQ